MLISHRKFLKPNKEVKGLYYYIGINKFILVFKDMISSEQETMLEPSILLSEEDANYADITKLILLGRIVDTISLGGEMQRYLSTKHKDLLNPRGRALLGASLYKGRSCEPNMAHFREVLEKNRDSFLLEPAKKEEDILEVLDNLIIYLIEELKKPGSLVHMIAPKKKYDGSNCGDCYQQIISPEGKKLLIFEEDETVYTAVPLTDELWKMYPDSNSSKMRCVTEFYRRGFIGIDAYRMNVTISGKSRNILKKPEFIYVPQIRAKK